MRTRLLAGGAVCLRGGSLCLGREEVEAQLAERSGGGIEGHAVAGGERPRVGGAGRRQPAVHPIGELLEPADDAAADARRRGTGAAEPPEPRPVVQGQDLVRPPVGPHRHVRGLGAGPLRVGQLAGGNQHPCPRPRPVGVVEAGPAAVGALGVVQGPLGCGRLPAQRLGHALPDQDAAP